MFCSAVNYRAKVYARDLFVSAFQADPMSKEVGRRYRQIVLQPGGSQDEMKMLENFLGRRPSATSLYRDLGIVV